jgi:hypothetical protein
VGEDVLVMMMGGLVEAAASVVDKSKARPAIPTTPSVLRECIACAGWWWGWSALRCKKRRGREQRRAEQAISGRASEEGQKRAVVCIQTSPHPVQPNHSTHTGIIIQGKTLGNSSSYVEPPVSSASSLLVASHPRQAYNVEECVRCGMF